MQFACEPVLALLLKSGHFHEQCSQKVKQSYFSPVSSSVRSYFSPSMLHAAIHSKSLHRRLSAAAHAALASFQFTWTQGDLSGAVAALQSEPPQKAEEEQSAPSQYASYRSMQNEPQ